MWLYRLFDCQNSNIISKIFVIGTFNICMLFWQYFLTENADKKVENVKKLTNKDTKYAFLPRDAMPARYNAVVV